MIGYPYHFLFQLFFKGFLGALVLPRESNEDTPPVIRVLFSLENALKDRFDRTLWWNVTKT
jgi:hypothetical protein